MYTAVALSTARYRPHSSTHGDLMVSRTRMIIHRPCSFAVYGPYVLNHLPLAVCIIHHTRTVLEQNKDVVLFSLQDSWPMSHYSHPLSSLVVFFWHLVRMDKNPDASQVIFEPPAESWRRHLGIHLLPGWRPSKVILLPWIWNCMKPENWLRIDLSGD